MKQPFEKRFWDFVLQPISEDTVEMIMATVWLVIFVGAVLIVFTLIGPEVIAP